jgi:hypothetical protein
MMRMVEVLTLRFGAASSSPILDDFCIGRDEEETSLHSIFEKVRQKCTPRWNTKRTAYCKHGNIDINLVSLVSLIRIESLDPYQIDTHASNMECLPRPQGLHKVSDLGDRLPKNNKGKPNPTANPVDCSIWQFPPVSGLFPEGILCVK